MSGRSENYEMKRFPLHLKRLLVGLVWLSLASRVVVPPGFMPASLEEGVPIKLCPGIVGGGGHGGHGTAEPSRPGKPGLEDGEPESGDEDGGHVPCPLGVLFASAFLVGSVDLMPYPLTDLERVPSGDTPFSQTVSAFVPQPRGPPLRSLLST